MSIASTAEPRESAPSVLLAALAASLKRLCVSYFTWRLERSALDVLRAMSDRQLSDFGLSRSDLADAVRGEEAHDCHRPAALDRPDKQARSVLTDISLHAIVHPY